MARYPASNGLPALRDTIATWATQRFALSGLDAERQVLPVNGTREAIFAFVQAALDRTRPAQVAVPNPFYQIYEGATLLAGGEPLYLDCTAENGFRPDVSSVSADTWRNVQIVFICSPGNPTGAVTPLAEFKQLIALADEHDFIIASDECYSELYLDEAAPPRDSCRPAPSLAATTIAAAWCSTRCPNAPTCRGYAQGSSPAMRICSRRSNATAPTTAARCHCRCSMPP